MLGYLSKDICRVATVSCKEQIMSKEHIFAPNGGYCVYYPSNLFRNVHGFENWGMFSVIPKFLLGNIHSCDAFRQIAHERKYLMDYKPCYIAAYLLCLQG